jgi:hypothetical protein
VAAAIGLSAWLAATGCVGQASRNDDHVGPWSYRPDARDHTQPTPGPVPMPERTDE